MENFELFEEELKRNNLDLKKYDFEDRYLYALRQYYEDINTFWGIYVSKKNHKNSLLITLLTIPTYKKEEFLKLLNSLNEKYFNVSFFLYYDEDKKNYDVRLSRCYSCSYEKFEAEFFMFLISETHSILKEVMPKLTRLKYD